MKRDHETMAKKVEDKENVIFELKKDLRSVKEELNTEKIRHRRSKVVQSRIPAPSPMPNNKAASSYKSAIPVPSSSTKVNGARSANSATASTPSSTSLPDSDIARIRSRVLKFLEENEPKKVDKIDILMKQYEGREYVLLEKMTKRCSKTPDKEDKDVNATETGSTVSSISDDRPMSRQERALAAHKARMLGIKNRR